MSQLTLKAKRRESGKHDAKRIRNQGLVPGVFYIKGKEGIPLVARPLDLRPIVYTSETMIIDLLIEGETEPRECVVKETKFDPVTDNLIHFDLWGITRDTLMTFDIPIVLKGQAIGVREGGLMQQSLHKVRIECLPVNMPKFIEVDVTRVSLGKSLYLKDVSVENVEFLVPKETVIMSVLPPRVGKEEAPAAAAATAAAAAPAAVVEPKAEKTKKE